MEFSELEILASQLLEQQKELDLLQEDISQLEQDLRELPRKSAGEKKFYALIGMDWDEPKIAEKLKQASEKKTIITKMMSEANSKIVASLSEKNFVIPLDPKPFVSGQVITFKYRGSATYANAVQELAHILGLAVPLKVDDVTIENDKISVIESEQHYAMEKVVSAFDKISKTVALKLSDHSKRMHYRL
ncbi:MAG: hypothetical protein JRN67_10260 [Nitrososphaerota archaeon]|nr:hypothetical protein [Nitrososphaerota archaeon]